MTVPAFARKLGERLPSDSERATANQLRQILAAHATDNTKLYVLDDDKKPCEITLTPALSNLLMELLRHVGQGDAVTLVPVSQMLTTQQAADILNVSRPFLISLLSKGKIEHTTVGRHRRIKAEHLFDYKRQRDERRSHALAELAELDAERLQPLFANRFTAFVDACALAGALKRNLLLTLAEAEFFRIRWSEPVLDEAQRAIETILAGKDVSDAAIRALRARRSMETAFEEAMTADFDQYMCICPDLPDANDVHVVAAALKSQAATIVTDNLKDFPAELLNPLSIEPWPLVRVRSTVQSSLAAPSNQ